MSPGSIDLKVVNDRATRVRAAVEPLREKAKLSSEVFLSHPDHHAATEAYLHRALESLSDIARHLLAKRFGVASSEYTSVAERCGELGLLSKTDAALFRKMIGYRNRLVHRYFEFVSDDLHRITREHAGDLLQILDRLESAAVQQPPATPI